MVDQELISAIREVVSEEVSGLKSEIRDLKEDVGELKEGFGVLKEDVGELKENFGVLKEDVGGLKGDFGSLKEQQGSLKEEMSKMRIELGYTNKKLDKLGQKVDHIEDQLGEFKEEVSQRFNGIDGELATINIRIDNAVKEQNQMRKDMKEGFKELNMSIQAVHALSQMNHLQIQKNEEKYHDERNLVNLG